MFSVNKRSSCSQNGSTNNAPLVRPNVFANKLMLRQVYRFTVVIKLLIR